MNTQYSKVEIDGRVLTVTLNRPAMRNALHADASHELSAVFDEFERNPDLWVAIVTGVGDKAFSAGADLRTVSDNSRPPVPKTGFAGLVWRFNRRKPIIAAVNGAAMGGGFEMALACDLIVAADTATFGLTEPRVGLAALGGGIQRLVQELGPKRASALLLTARKIGAQEAMALGLLAEVVPAEDLTTTARRWADAILECSPTAVRATKAVMQSYFDEGLETSNESMFNLPEVRQLLTSQDAREGPKAFAEKRSPSWADPA